MTADHAAIFGDVIDRATRRCGPCVSGGEPVRDHLPAKLSPEARAAALARLDFGERKYGAVLCVGHENAEIDLMQEFLDGVIYAACKGHVGPDMDALIILANRAVAGTFGKHL